jgi:hypothetical protein
MLFWSRNLRVSVVWGSGFLMALGATIRCVSIGIFPFSKQSQAVFPKWDDLY